MSHPQNALGDRVTISNDAKFGNSVRDLGGADEDDSAAATTAFSGMTSEQRFMMDVHGWLKLPSLLAPAEVAAMLHGSFSHSRGGEAGGGGFGARKSDPLAYPDMEALATHPAILDVVKELQEGAPRLVQSSTWHDEPATAAALADARAGVLHSQRERDQRYVTYTTRPPGRISCDNVVVFVYLDTVRDGDGGLCVLPGS